jgi:hypothetical protein
MKRLGLVVLLVFASVGAVLGADQIEQVVHPAVPLPGMVVVASAPPEVAGYDRSCRRGDACVFGPAWSDDVDVAGGHDGCDTRNGILAAQLQQVTFRPGTHNCVVASGALADPYSGEAVDLPDVQIDHVFPLAAAWSRGAASWSLQRRKNFANDPRNLLAVSSRVNRSKSDKLPDRWTPPAAAGRCTFAARFVEVARIYQLTITKAENDALARLLTGCSKAPAK